MTAPPPKPRCPPWLASILVATMVGGCGIDRISNPFSGGASMQIEVEVYKGPLSKEPEIQWTEFRSIIDEAAVSLATFNDQLLALAVQLGYLESPVEARAASDAWRADLEVAGRALVAVKNASSKLGESKPKEFDEAVGAWSTKLETLRGDVERADVAAAVLVESLNAPGSDVAASDRARGSLIGALEALGKSAIAARTAAGRVPAPSAPPAPAGKPPVAAVPLGSPPPAPKAASAKADDRKAAEKVAEEISKGTAAADRIAKNAEKLKGSLEKGDLADGVKALQLSRLRGPLTVRPHFRGAAPDHETRSKTETRSVSEIDGRGLPGSGVGDESGIAWCAGASFRESLRSGVLDRRFSDCLTFAHLHDEVQHLTRLTRGLLDRAGGLDPENPTFIELIRRAADTAARFKIKAFYWAEAQMVAPRSERAVRLMMTAFSNLAAEYGNQMASRADTLLKQCRGTGSQRDLGEGSCTGSKREQLPLSVYLREINPTEFLNLFAYNRAAGPPIPEEILMRPLWGLGTTETTDRIRVIERLFADHNWSRINTVHANGRGDVAMAFIKDDIGNWNLKSFSNDPTELANAYTGLVRAAVGSVVSVAGGAGGASVAEKALSLASRAARGRVGPPSAEAAGVDLKALSSAISGQVEIAAERRKTAEGQAAADKRVEARRQSYNELRAILVQYDAMLESLQSAVATQARADAPGVLDQLGGIPTIQK